MRVLLITETYPPDRGGMGESCDRIVRGFGRAGVAVDVVHFDRKSAAASFHQTSHGSLSRMPSNGDPAHAINLLWNRLQQNLDFGSVTHVVAFGGTLPLLAAPVFAAWMGRPLVTLIRGNELDAGLFDPRRRPVLDDALRRSDAICTVTVSQATKIAALHPGTQPHVVPNGIDFELWQATDTDRARGAAWRAQHVAPSRRLLGFFGHLKSKKGVPFFIDSLVRSGLADRFHLLLVGEVEEAVAAMLPELSHSLVPSVDRFDLIPYYTAADLVVLPSHYDGFPNVLIEAATLGKPLLASAVGGMLDVLTDGANAFLFAPGDEHACRDAIARAAVAELQQMGDAAEALARARFDAADETRRYVEVLEIVQEEFDAKADRDRGVDPAARRLPWRAHGG